MPSSLPVESITTKSNLLIQVDGELESIGMFTYFNLQIAGGFV
jgi:hypothetical protein